MADKEHKITVKEIKEIEPKADIYELNKYSKYLVMIKKSSLVGGNAAANQKAKIIASAIKALNIPCIILIGVDEDVKFMELS